MNNILLTFDYELFFGRHTGTQENCMIKPTNFIVELLDKYNIKATFFVDSGYILKLQEYKELHPILEERYDALITQIKALDKGGHSIQLHIHPHWEDSYFNGDRWVVNTSRYRLHDFSSLEIDEIVRSYKKVLTDIIGDKIFAHRAGGWCIQPFSALRKAFKKHNIWLDSTVFQNGKNHSETHYFDFKHVPNKTEWNFEETPTQEWKDGFFTEVPISSYRVSPFFFWKLVYYKKFGGDEYKIFGDGTAAGGSKWDKLRMLTRATNSVVSVDGLKVSFLEQAYQKFLKREDFKNFVIIGHPKSTSKYSLKKLETFILKHRDKNFITIGSFNNEIENN